MKNILILFIALLNTAILNAQTNEAEAEIRNLEQMEVKAVLAKDSVTLLKLWDKNYTVNAPDNHINFAGNTTLDRPVLRMSRTSFTRDIEHISIRGNFAFSMGSETVVPGDGQAQTGATVKRRYTNIWEKQGDGWKLVARHANVICAK